MPGLTVTRRRIWEGSDPEPLALIVGRDEGAIQTTDLITANGNAGTGVDFYLYEENNTTPIETQEGLDPSNGHPDGSSAIIYDTLQTDGRWKANTVGYNFRYAIRDADLTTSMEGGKTYIAEFFINTTAWGVIPAVWVYEVVATRTK